MAFVGLSLILASVIYVFIRRPSFVETLTAIWRGYPQIQQPSSTRPPPPSNTYSHTTGSAAVPSSSGPSLRPGKSTKVGTDKTAISPPPPTIVMSDDNSQAESSPQTTPKAVASSTNSGGNVPSLSLSNPTPASAASIARAPEHALPSATPSLSSAPAPTPATNPSPPSGLMAPPPRPPSLKPVAATAPSTLLSPGTSSSSSLMPPRNGPLPNRNSARQSGSSTLAPPTQTSSTRSKKVLLEPGHSPLDWARLANDPNSDLRNLPPGTPYLRVTPSMLKAHSGRKGSDAWTALGGRVYNITPYIPFHPGGKGELLRCAGKDGTRLFDEIHRWVNYESMLGSCLIGLLVDENEAQSDGNMDAMD